MQKIYNIISRKISEKCFGLFALRYCQTLHQNYSDLLQEKSNQYKISKIIGIFALYNKMI
jgi:hypothetical protein